MCSGTLSCADEVIHDLARVVRIDARRVAHSLRNAWARLRRTSSVFGLRNQASGFAHSGFSLGP
ncbi:hypothetical protein PENSPDRAFT_660134, partial [Peniophora sp. CONT]